MEWTLEGVGGPEVAALHGLPDASFDIVMLRVGSTRLELLRFHSPEADQGRPPPANAVGGVHVAFEVEDAIADYEAMSAQGVEFASKPLVISEGESAGHVLAFCHDPDGYRVELIQIP